MVTNMKPYETLSESVLADGTKFSLHRHDGNFYLKYNGFDLMSTVYTFSEQQLAEVGCSEILQGKSSSPSHPRVLIGGLGLGFTLKRALELVGSPATVEVAELLAPLIEWNTTFLVEHNGPLLEDPRTQIIEGDLYDILMSKPNGSYDAHMAY
jgi:spermidine synthase